MYDYNVVGDGSIEVTKNNEKVVTLYGKIAEKFMDEINELFDEIEYSYSARNLDWISNDSVQGYIKDFLVDELSVEDMNHEDINPQTRGIMKKTITIQKELIVRVEVEGGVVHPVEIPEDVKLIVLDKDVGEQTTYTLQNKESL